MKDFNVRDNRHFDVTGAPDGSDSVVLNYDPESIRRAGASRVNHSVSLNHRPSAVHHDPSRSNLPALNQRSGNTCYTTVDR